MTHTAFHIRRRTSTVSSKARAGLLMTATLVPPKAAVARNDPGDRLNDYTEALRFYLSLPDTVIDRIVLTDNSNSDITPLVNLAESLPHEKDLDLISFAGNDHPYQLGKAYGEFKLMDFGILNTSLFGPDDVIWKTTGRLKFVNFEQMSQRCASLDFDVLCDLHNLPLIGSGQWRHYCNMDLRLFAFRRSAYEPIFGGLWKTRTEGFDAEFMYHRMMQERARFRVIPRFPLQARLQGISGRHQRDYISGPQRVKDTVRSAVRRLAPWVWL